MANKTSIVKGTRDFGPQEMAKRNYIFNTIRSVYELYGFQQIETPAMETLGTLMGTMLGGSADAGAPIIGDAVSAVFQALADGALLALLIP